MVCGQTGKKLHISILELKVVSLALKRFKDQCQNQTVLVPTDNLLHIWALYKCIV